MSGCARGAGADVGVEESPPHRYSPLTTPILISVIIFLVIVSSVVSWSAKKREEHRGLAGREAHYKRGASAGARAIRLHLFLCSALSLPAALAFLFLGRAPMLVYVRPSSEVTDDPSKLARYFFRDGG